MSTKLFMTINAGLEIGPGFLVNGHWENFKVSKAQTPFNFLGQKESIPQILGHLAVI